MKLALHHYRLPLKHTFSISRESNDVQDTLIVSLSSGGNTGYGEATANTYYKSGIAEMKQQINAIRAEIESYTLGEPKDFHAFLKTKGISNFCLCA